MTVDTQRRQSWISVLAHTPEEELEDYFKTLTAGALPAYVHLRQPDTGLVMVRGRMGGEGNRFNLGEVTATRCSVKLEDGTAGHGYVLGRSLRHAELAAIIDALLQTEEFSSRIDSEFIVPQRQQRETRRKEYSKKTAATKVNFLTMDQI